MNHDTHPSSIEQRGWLERLSHALLREPQDREQLIELLHDAAERDLLDADALTMIEGVLAVSVMQVREIMIPRTQMITIDEQTPLADILTIVTDSGHSRFPVTNQNRDTVIGILLAKDLLKYNADNDENFLLQQLLRPCVLIPESKRLDALLQYFRRKRQHMAIVADEYGCIAGLITIEDILEQIVGEIEDEHDTDDDSHIKRQTENEYTIQALTPIEAFNHYFTATLDENDFDTVGGLVLHAFGHVPEIGENIIIENFQFTVLQADDRRLHVLQLSVLQ